MSDYTKRVAAVLAVAAFPLAAGCGSSTVVKPPRELLDARQAYQQAQHGAAGEASPAQLHVARAALDRAETSFRADPENPVTRDYAYLAERSAQLAEADGERATAIEQRDKAVSAAAAAEEQRLRASEDERLRAAEQLRQAQEETKQAEARANAALGRLGSAAHEEGARGTVITLPTGILFTTGSAALLPSSKTQLDQVVQALKEVGGRDITIEGYTDSVGNEAENEVLSEKRAEAVRAYLIAQGVPANRVNARGFGQANPLGDNATLEGRAKNRRVEIVVHRAQTPTQ